MNHRFFLAVFAVCLAGGLMTTSAEAGFRVQAQDGSWFYYPGAGYVPVPYVFRYVLPPGLNDGPDQPGPDGRFDESYYDPSFDEPPAQPKPLKKKPVSKTATAMKPVTKTTTATTKPVTATATKTASAAAATEPQPPKGALACDKATGIVSGFGFANVKAASCTGQVYSFSGARDGKNFAIKLDAATGELTEVKKVQ
jgi:hypothetical protein